MAETKIEWTAYPGADGVLKPGFTMNFWIGCTKVGPPCDHCYAETLSNRYGWVTWGAHGERKRTSAANWKKPLQWAKAARGTGERPRVFSLSLGDWLDNQVPQSWRDDMGAVIRDTPELDWLLLTKRIQNFKRLAPWQKPPANVWLGITCGSQPEYDRDWPILAGIEASVRFISYEPALGPLRPKGSPAPDWIICGGESGPQARYMEPEWATRMKADCAALGIAFFMKQMTGKKPIPDDLMVRQFPRPQLLEAA